jgi:hypothetical protein
LLPHALCAAQRAVFEGLTATGDHLIPSEKLRDALMALRAALAAMPLPAAPSDQGTQAVAASGSRHELKTDPSAFDAVAAGHKTFEIRWDDRGFAVGDDLVLRRTQHTGAEMEAGSPLMYTGESLQVRVTHVMRDRPGLAEGWVILSIALAAQPVKAAFLQDAIDRWDAQARAKGYADIHSAMDAVPEVKAASPVAWLYRGGGHFAPTDDDLWHLKMGATAPDLGWTHQEKMPVYAGPNVTCRVGVPKGWAIRLESRDLFKPITVTAPNGYTAVVTNTERNPANVLYLLAKALLEGGEVAEVGTDVHAELGRVIEWVTDLPWPHGSDEMAQRLGRVRSALTPNGEFNV